MMRRHVPSRFRLMVLLVALLCLAYALNDGGYTGISSAASVEILKDETNRRTEQEQILDAVIADVLSNPALQFSRDTYGTPFDKRIGLHSDSQVSWPRGYRVNVPGYSTSYVVAEERNPKHPRLLGFTVHHLDLSGSGKNELYEHPIAISLCNLGGEANGAAHGGCLIQYSFKRIGKRVHVTYESSVDP